MLFFVGALSISAAFAATVGSEDRGAAIGAAIGAHLVLCLPSAVLELRRLTLARREMHRRRSRLLLCAYLRIPAWIGMVIGPLAALGLAVSHPSEWKASDPWLALWGLLSLVILLIHRHDRRAIERLPS